jgi:pantoate--beta-alanine ligase
MPIPQFRYPNAFVPTMGALHIGHESLIKLARQYCEEVVVSIFVNPLQFENPKDLESYPGKLGADTKVAIRAGATKVWAPTLEDIYPDRGNQFERVIKIESGALGEKFEGASRPGHFDGMLTVVKRLFEVVNPAWAIFGEKDFQQLALVKQMVQNLGMPTQIISAPLIREIDGLALSSRNVRLTSEGRAAALVISKALYLAANEVSLSAQLATLNSVLIGESRFILDYAVIIVESNFEPADSEKTNNRALVAGWVDGVRLLDNMKMPRSDVIK